MTDDRGKSAGSDEGKADTFTQTIDAAEKNAAEDEARQYGPNERRVKSLMASKHIDPSVDLTSADANDAVMEGQPSILNHDHSVSETSRTGSKMSKKSRAQMELMRKYNRHGMLVLDTTAGKSNGSQPITTPTATAAGAQPITSDDQRYHQRLNDSLTLTDLQEEVAVEYEVLPLQRNGFFAEGGGSGAAARAVKGEQGDEEENSKAVRSFSREVREWRQDVVRDALPLPSQALVVLQEVSLASRAMNRAGHAHRTDPRSTTNHHSRRRRHTRLRPDTVLRYLLVRLSSLTVCACRCHIQYDGRWRYADTGRVSSATPQALRDVPRAVPPLLRLLPVLTEQKRSKLQRIKLAIDSAYQGLLLLKGDCNRQGQAVLCAAVGAADE